MLVYTDAWSTTLFRLGHIHAFLYLGSEIIESLFNVDIVLGGNLEEGDAQLICQLLALLSRNSPLFLPVAFISNEDLVHTLTCMLFNI